MEIQTVYGPAEIERLTGIPMNTLRAWERRYGVPRPQRGPGGHRVYSENELQTLQWLRKQLNAGVSISHAIANLRAQQPAAPNLHPESLVNELLEACQLFDDRRAEKVLSDAFAFHTVERVCVHVIAPTLVRIGDMWQAGEISVAQEHFCSSVLTAQLYAVLRTLPVPQIRPLFFVACPPGERHVIAPLIFTVLMRRAGWRALFFGADLPLEELADTIPELKPDMLVLSITLPQSISQLKVHLDTMKSRAKLPPVILGGLPFHSEPTMAAQLGCHYLGNDMLAAIGKLDGLVGKLGILASRT